MPAPQPGFRVEYPDPDTRYLLPPEKPNPQARDGVVLPQHFEASVDGLKIDGQPFPWHVHLVALQVDQIAPGWNVVYVPMVINGEVVAGEGVQEATLIELLGPDDQQPPPAYDGEDHYDDHAHDQGETDARDEC